MKLTCADCHLDLTGSQINVQANTATCPRCGVIYPISGLIGADNKRVAPVVEEYRVRKDFDISKPPTGVTYENQGYGWSISTSTRSWFGWIMMLVFLVWNGVTIGVLIAPQVIDGEFNLLQLLFAIPFLLIGSGIGAFAMLLLFGKTIVASDERDRDAGSVRLGVGPLAWTQHFRWSEVTQVCETDSGGEVNGQSVLQITLRRDQGDINFGSLLKDERRRYMIDALRQLLEDQLV